jgi:hypothetical protein
LRCAWDEIIMAWIWIVCCFLSFFSRPFPLSIWIPANQKNCSFKQILLIQLPSRDCFYYDMILLHKWTEDFKPLFHTTIIVLNLFFPYTHSS